MRFSELFLSPAITWHLSVTFQYTASSQEFCFTLFKPSGCQISPPRKFCLSLGSTTGYPGHVQGPPDGGLTLTDIWKSPALNQVTFSLEFTRRIESFQYYGLRNHAQLVGGWREEKKNPHLKRADNVYRNSERHWVPPLMSFTMYICLDCKKINANTLKLIKIQRQN